MKIPEFPEIDAATREQRLRLPEGRLPVVLDTDTYNEIDDQFALTYALLSPERIDLQAVHIAPFSNALCPKVEESIDMSYAEAHRVLDAMNVPGEGMLYRGLNRYLTSGHDSEPTDASEDLIRRALARPEDSPLIVVAIGAITNISNALIRAPEIVRHIVVVWLGGHAFRWPDTKEFNLHQDVIAARVLLESGVPLIQVPCWGVASHLTITYPEVEAYVEPCGQIGAFLAQIYRNAHPDRWGNSHILWDTVTIALLNQADWTPMRTVATPVLTDAVTWARSGDPERHSMGYVYFAWRDAIIRDFLKRLKAFSEA